MADRLLGRLAILGGALLLVGVVAKVLAVSKMDLTVAQVVATQSSPSAIVFGSLLLFFPTIPVIGMNLALLAVIKEILLAMRSAREKRKTEKILYPAVAFGVFLTLGAYLTPRDYFLSLLFLTLLMPLSGAIIAAIFFAVQTFKRRQNLEKRPAMSRPPGRTGRGLALALFAIYAAGITFVALPVFVNEIAWLPPRQVELTEASGFVGYEISRTDVLVTFLRESDRKIVEVELDLIESAEPCRLAKLINTAAPFMPPATQHFQATDACT